MTFFKWKIPYIPNQLCCTKRHLFTLKPFGWADLRFAYVKDKKEISKGSLFASRFLGHENPAGQL